MENEFTDKTNTISRANAQSISAHAKAYIHSNYISPITKSIQPKLTVNQSNDVYEQHADNIAEQVMSMDNSFIQTKPLPVFFLQRKCAACEEEENEMQRKEFNGEKTHIGNELENYVGNLNDGGQQLPDDLRSFYEPRFGYGFENVKVHTDSVAAKSAQSINALAYTSGNNIIFNQGQYSPETDSGKRLLAHELTHVVQQGTPDNSISRYLQRKPVCDDDGVCREDNEEPNYTPADGGESTPVSTPAEPNYAPLAAITGMGVGSTLAPGTPEIPFYQPPQGIGEYPKMPFETPFNPTMGQGATSTVTETATTAAEVAETATTAAEVAETATTTAAVAGTGTGATGGLAGLLLEGGLVGLAAIGGVAAGIGLDKGVNYLGQKITGDEQGDYSISGAIGKGLTSADRAISSLWADPSKPDYTQTLGWKIANLSTPTIIQQPGPDAPSVQLPVPGMQSPTPAIDPTTGEMLYTPANQNYTPAIDPVTGEPLQMPSNQNYTPVEASKVKPGELDEEGNFINDEKLYITPGGLSRVKRHDQDLPQVEDVAKNLGMTKEGRDAFRDYIHQSKVSGDLGSGGDGDRTYGELFELGQKFLEEFPKYRE